MSKSEQIEWLNDPRSDIKEDHIYWVAVLMQARKMDEAIWGILHGLRCCEARIEKSEDGKLKLNYKPALENTGMTEEELLNDWLVPNKKNIALLFKTVTQRLEGF